ncbi:hypothetical protein BUALT_Bualt16G0116300 [Buddleja alternifolia]|uniref:AAA+ ATPase domain-containing protein n=1 Tax=Buddleja alternifolia TaxID=168488 RepID=A0AAV6WAY7_9LAMI|nr:hypothetical protein BUALT_Bualt16G0116300 [Buddleja alternifolia]
MKIVGFMLVRALLEQYFPHPHHLKNSVQEHSEKLFTFLSPRIQITFKEFTGDRLTRNEAYSAIETYLSSISSAQARRLKADIVKSSSPSLFLSMDDDQKVADEFEGVKVWWSSEGKAIETKTRKRRLFTNSGSSWSHAPFENPATFQTLAMEPENKREIVKDLLAFSESEDFHSKIGRVWRRVYSLDGPPGTGKSTMIAAMANLMGYDVYDLELTAVKDTTELKKLLMETSRKAIIVIRDLAGPQATKLGETKEQEQNDHFELLHFVDGIWSGFGGGRIIVFTTNNVEKLGSDWMGRCRMDKHIEMSYCGFEGFKVLAKSYLDLEWHHLFPRIESLLGEMKITPADVAEILMPKNVPGNAEICLKNLISTLEGAEEK